jgi:hypothetical protein
VITSEKTSFDEVITSGTRRYSMLALEMARINSRFLWNQDYEDETQEKTLNPEAHMRAHVS